MKLSSQGTKIINMLWRKEGDEVIVPGGGVGGTYVT